MNMEQKLNELLDRLARMTEFEKSELEAAYAEYREAELRGSYDVPPDVRLDIPEELKH